MEKKVQWGIIGAGGIAKRRMLPAMMQSENTEVVALMDKDLDSLRELSKDYNIGKIYVNEDDLLENLDVEAVYVASPVVFHLEQAKKVLRAGKHLLLEKPLTLDVAQAMELLAIYEQSNVLAMPAMVMRFHPGHQEIRKLIKTGELGEIVSCRAQLTCWFPDMENNWRQYKETAGGGALMDMGIHCIDLLSYLTGQEIVKVGGLIDTKTFKYEVEDSASILLQLKNGANCYVDVNNNIPDEAANCFLEIYGTKGSIIARGTIGQDGSGEIEMVLSDQSNGYDIEQKRETSSSKVLEYVYSNPYERQITAFTNSILASEAPPIQLTEGVQVLRVIETAYKAAKQGAFITLQ